MGRVATGGDDPPCPLLRTLVCQDSCVSSHQRATERACMSIKDESKRASGESLKGKSLRQSVVPESRIPNPRLRIVTDFMNANLHRRIRLAELAGTANLSSSRFSHVFKTQTGLSPGEYLRRLRMEKARHLLATSLLRIKEIMAMAGYNSKSHFVRHFRRSFGPSPSEYRKSVSSS